MATATSTITPSLTPSQQAAREFWRQTGADGMPPFYVMSQYYAQLSANSDNLPAVTAALEQLLTGLGYATDVDTVFSELTAGQGEELGYWAGRYCLFDSDGNRLDLVVGRNGATLTVAPALVDMTALPASTDMASVTVLSSVGFSDGVLQLANAQFQASLSFALPVNEADFDDPSHPAAAMFQSTAARCNGTFGAKSDGAAASRPVNGKRGAWTRAGVNQTADGDPAAAWYGQYVLLDVTEVMAVVQAGGADAGTASVVQVPEPVYIYNDPSFGLTFQCGDHYGRNVTYSNNVLQCGDEDDDTTQYVMQFVAPQAGAAELNLAVTRAGVVRSYKGYWVGRYPPLRPVSQARLAKEPMTATYSAASDAAAGGYSKAIDVSSLTPGETNTVALPYGAVGNTYALTLNLTNCVATDTFSWAVTNNPTGRAAITLTGGQSAQFSLNNLSDSDVGQQLQVTVQLTNNSAKPAVTYTLLLNIKVIQCGSITLAPPVLPPVVVGTPYSQNLSASGANGNFTWSTISSSLPPDLTWDDGRHQLSGKVTDASQIGKAFSLVVGLAASDVIMDPLTTSLPITVQSGAAVASGVPSWAEILIKASPGIIALTVIAAFALKRLLAGKANPKTIEVLTAGNTNIENATNRDPRFISRSIVQAERQRLPIVQRNLPYSQTLIEHVARVEEDLAETLDQGEALIARMRDYLNKYLDEHNTPENPPNSDDLVEDQELSDQGWRTIGALELGLPLVASANEAWRTQLATVASWLNGETTKIALDQIAIDEHSEGESNDQRLLIDQSV